MPRTRKAAPGVDVRLALLDAAGQLLLAEGADGITTRRLAAMAGTTTQAIYTEFGGKEGVARAMYREGFARLEARMRAVPETDDPLYDLFLQAHVYREAAVDNRHFYDVMFGRPIPEFEPDADDLQVSRIAQDLLTHVVERVIATGALKPDVRADVIAQWLWVVVHGAISLEFHGAITLDDATYDDYLALSLASYLAEPHG